MAAMKQPGVLAACVAGLLAFLGGPAWSQPLPARPDVPTVAACQAYLQATYAALQAYYAQSSACMSSTPPRIAVGPECSTTRRQVIMGTRAWPHCGQAEQHCSLLRANDDARVCVEQARSREREQGQAREAALKLKQMEDEARHAYGTLEAARRLVDDPRVFVKTELARWLDRSIVSSLFDRGGQLSERGLTQTQQLYDYIFDATAGNRGLYAANPLISAIQEQAFDQLRRIMHDTLASQDKLIAEVGRITQDPAPRPIKSAPAPRRPEASVDCSILDSPAGSDLAIDAPERFEELVRRCR